ncbi:HTH-type transcriptional regulator, LysR-family [Aliivibrio wodanis]|uniref:HTH-type transcriptional regulator, LysR-family n=1 Tax=Aliivibrio wodanis TaxID=80852 RepID=A0A090IBC9_9GAMM|nr:HTH-type transcriptional regulator, LysR-family [Aliivibrio wodanis]VVV06721.1 HTH-type transcriptional regulator DmlR [Aliivibrio wodanis]
MDKVTAAKVFIDVAHSESFTATAERLEMSRSMVTRYVEAMEAWLNTRLLHRTTRKVSLTTIGVQYLAEIQQWVETADNIVNQIQPLGEIRGSIRLAVSMSFGHSQLMAALTEFMAVHSKVSIDVDIQDVATDLIKNRIDLAIRIASSPDPTLIGKPIAKCHSVLVASEHYLTTNSQIQTPEDLLNHSCLGYKNFERHIWHLRQEKEYRSVEIKCRLTANEATALMEAAVHGAGITMQPTYLVHSLIQNGTLKQVLPSWTPQSMDIFVLYPSRRHLSPAVRALIDFLADYFENKIWNE